jgi:Amt family ammonium transporter
VKKALGYDDSLDVFGVHGVGGIVGALLTGVFADASINALGKDASLATQFYGVAVTIIYTAVVTAIIMYVIKAVIGLRPTEAQEEEGLDITLHGETVQ